MNATIRAARPGDERRIWELIGELAEYEKLPYLVTGTAEALGEHLFGPTPFVYAMVAETEGIVGYVLYFTNYSTFRTQPGIWMEDLYVTPPERGKGIGKALLLAVAKQVHESGWGRHEWAVLDWNQPAIDFYESLGAVVMPDWRVCRVEDNALQALAERM